MIPLAIPSSISYDLIKSTDVGYTLLSLVVAYLLYEHNKKTSQSIQLLYYYQRQTTNNTPTLVVNFLHYLNGYDPPDMSPALGITHPTAV